MRKRKVENRAVFTERITIRTTKEQKRSVNYLAEKSQKTFTLLLIDALDREFIRPAVTDWGGSFDVLADAYDIKDKQGFCIEMQITLELFWARERGWSNMRTASRKLLGTDSNIPSNYPNIVKNVSDQ